MIRVLVLLLCLIGVPVHAFYDAMDKDKRSFTLSLAGQRANSTLAVTGVVPIERLNQGFFGAYWGRQTGKVDAESVVLSEVVNLRVQGAVDVPYGDIEFFVSGERDDGRKIDWITRTGYYYSPGTFEVRDVDLTVGLGNYTERQENKAVLEDDSFGGISFGFLGVAYAKYRAVGAKLIVRPTIVFDAATFEASGTYHRELTDELSLSVSGRAIYETEMGTVTSQYLLGLTYIPKE